MLWRIQVGPINRCSKVVNFWSTIRAKQNKAKEPFNNQNWPTEEMVDLNGEPTIVITVQEEVGQLKGLGLQKGSRSCLCFCLPSSQWSRSTARVSRCWPPSTNWEFSWGQRQYPIHTLFGPSPQWGSKVNLYHRDGLKWHWRSSLRVSDWQEWEFQSEENFRTYFENKVKHSGINGLTASRYHF